MGKFDGLDLPEYLKAKCAVIETVIDFPSAKKFKSEDDMYKDFINKRKLNKLPHLMITLTRYAMKTLNYLQWRLNITQLSRELNNKWHQVLTKKLIRNQ